MKKGLLVAAAVVTAGVATLVVLVAPRLSAQNPQPAERDRNIVRSIVRMGGTHIGASVRDVTDADVTAGKLASPAGAYVQAVTPGGPAAVAGLRAGDVVVSFDGERVRSASHLVRLVSETATGRAVEAVVQREGQRVTLRVTPDGSSDLTGGRPFVMPDLSDLDERIQRAIPAVPDIRLGNARLGIAVQELTPQLATYFGVADGVLVTTVTTGSPAATAGVKAGDIITKVDGTAVETATALRRRVSQASTDLTLTVTRDRKELTLKVAVPSTPRPASRTSI